MNRLIIAAAMTLVAGAASAQTTSTTTAPSNDSSVMSGSSTMNNNDAALPGGSEARPTGTTPTIVPVPSTSGGTSSQPTTDTEGQAERANETTPSSGIVPAQTPE